MFGITFAGKIESPKCLRDAICHIKCFLLGQPPDFIHGLWLCPERRSNVRVIKILLSFDSGPQWHGNVILSTYLGASNHANNCASLKAARTGAV